MCPHTQHRQRHRHKTVRRTSSSKRTPPSGHWGHFPPTHPWLPVPRLRQMITLDPGYGVHRAHPHAAAPSSSPGPAAHLRYLPYLTDRYLALPYFCYGVRSTAPPPPSQAVLMLVCNFASLAAATAAALHPGVDIPTLLPLPSVPWAADLQSHSCRSTKLWLTKADLPLPSPPSLSLAFHSAHRAIDCRRSSSSLPGP